MATSPANPNAPTVPNGPIPADRPFHSLSYPDINYTIMRPAALPPSAFTDATNRRPRRPRPHGLRPGTRVDTSATPAYGTPLSTRVLPPT